MIMKYGAVESERRRSRDMVSEERRPLLAESGDKMDDTKVEMPDLPHITSPEVVNIPDDILKTFLCAIFMGCGSIATAFSIALNHERYPDFQQEFSEAARSSQVFDDLSLS